MDIELLLARVLFIAGFAIAGLAMARILRIDSSITCVAAGVLAGLSLPHLMFDTGIRAWNLQDLVFLLILPVLVFQSAWRLEPGVVRTWWLPSLTLAVAGVLIAAGVGGLLMYLGMGHPAGFPWAAALLAAAIIAATDPGLVCHRLWGMSVAPGLPTLLESEGMLNDVTAVLLFGALLALAQQALAAQAVSSAGGSLAWMFAWKFSGGLLVGLAAGALTAGLVAILRDGHHGAVVLPFSALGSYYVAEYWLDVSGILAVAGAALFSRHLLRGRRDDLLTAAREGMAWLGTLLNATLFTLMGLVITFDMFTGRWLAMLIAIGAGLAARFAGVFASAGLSHLAGRGISWRWQVILGWGGARGAVAIALVLALPETLPYWWTIQSMVFGVVLFGLLVQGPTTPLLVRRLLPHPSA